MTTEGTWTSSWQRVDASAVDGRRCLDAIQSRYIGWTMQELGDQGYCSLTLLVCDCREPQNSDIQSPKAEMRLLVAPAQARIVQIRPARYALDLTVAQAAKQAYPGLAPFVRKLDLDLPSRLCVYEMQRLPGTPLSRVLPRSQVLDSSAQKKQEYLIESFAAVIAQGFRLAQSKGRMERADSPMEDQQLMLVQCNGKVGSSIVSRLERLGDQLPDSQLRDIAINVLAHIRSLDDYPVVLNHGDLIPSNILVDENTWQITGLVDWAEAEYLPFGTCLYGLEHFLGYLCAPQDSLSPITADSSTGNDKKVFVYYNSAAQLRELFWRRLSGSMPFLKHKEDDVRVMRDLGVLLWYGFAWDDGAIDRVVDDLQDPVEMACLRAFLDVE
ncbi:hypothetical protein DE146DRAFT_648857 [Phaeosphaeria sp. MPI-PUGE-AT-0046c]|nr:hypothetical protein DE146DRAFT_648857 [Phaeosphaeria sp. MPI-PUGE-AT-0046c]